ncbi:hypothetical protein SY86_15965 [Erwinia tracheiphila]|uniref:Uncharacterized protein n=1 Tax=Erwinia tracheiphila TaxID=65700 RepID=A0A0M2KCC0_9GAMM|nr:hypothetical protein SY86_15965 [Erwinia tracheiphila]
MTCTFSRFSKSLPRTSVRIKTGTRIQKSRRLSALMVRKLNHRFKNFLTMSSSVCNAVMMCHRERYGHKMAFAARF